MMASYKDTRAGWEIFQGSDYTLTLPEINDRLKKAGGAPVSDRTFRHYWKLVRFGYEHYVPINQLDVKTLQNPVWDAATRNRYSTIEAQIPVTVRIVREGDVVELQGHATRLSESLVVVHLVDSPNVGQLTDQAAGLPAHLTFRSTGEVVLATIDAISIRARPKRVSLRLGVLRPLPIPSVLGRETFEPAELLIRLRPLGEGEVLLTQAVQEVYWLFQAVESASVIASEILLGLDRKGRFAVPPSQVVRLRLESPLEVVLILTFAAGFILDRTVGKYIKYRKEFWEGSVAKQTAEKLKQELEWERERRHVLDKIDIDDVTHEAAEAMATRLAVSLPKSDPPFDQDKIRGIGQRQLLPSVQELVETVEVIEIESVEPEGPETV